MRNTSGHQRSTCINILMVPCLGSDFKLLSFPTKSRSGESKTVDRSSETSPTSIQSWVGWVRLPPPSCCCCFASCGSAFWSFKTTKSSQWDETTGFWVVQVFFTCFFASNLVILGQSLAPPPFHYYRNPLPSPSEKNKCSVWKTGAVGRGKVKTKLHFPMLSF